MEPAAERGPGTAASAEWDATAYDRVSDSQLRWAEPVVARLRLRGAERVLDAGCGSGRVTERLLERLPGGHVVAVDRSRAMLGEARRRLAAYRGRVSFVQADLAEPLPLTPVDAVLSTATLHWVRDHDRLFRHLAAVLHPGGQLVAQCGGAGNIASVREVMRSVGLPAGEWTYPTAAETERRLRAVGFTDVRCWLHREPTPLPPGEPLETFLRVVVLREQLLPLPADERQRLVATVAARLPRPEIDFVRLDIDGRLPP